VICIPNHKGFWVVENAEHVADAWWVTARKLNARGQYNKKRRALTFTQNTHYYSNCINGVTTHGRMEQTFVQRQGIR
jgi:hypothetical protein